MREYEIATPAACGEKVCGKLSRFTVYFRVHNITELSDHCLIESCLNYNFTHNDTDISQNKYRPKWPKFIWDDSCAESFISALLDNDVADKHAKFITDTFEYNLNGINNAVTRRYYTTSGYEISKNPILLTKNKKTQTKESMVQ